MEGSDTYPPHPFRLARWQRFTQFFTEVVYRKAENAKVKDNAYNG